MRLRKDKHLQTALSATTAAEKYKNMQLRWQCSVIHTAAADRQRVNWDEMWPTSIHSSFVKLS